MKKFVNDPAAFVPEFMKGIALANPDLLDFNAEFQMITRKSGPNNAKVSVVQGSGSGHEPAHVMVIDGNRFFAFEYRLETSYVVFVHDEEAGGGFRPAVRIEGTGIAGNRSDRVILRQVSPKGGYESHCDRRYAYGWDVVNGEAPLDSGSDQ